MSVRDSGKKAPWSIVLAGGEGDRMKSVIEPWLGEPRPKQYCTFVGSRSMLQHTLDRSASVVPASRTITVIGKDHRDWLAESTRPGQSGIVLEQPVNRGTAVGLLLAATYALEHDPTTTLLVFPADHFVHPEPLFLRHVISAYLYAQRFRDQVILLGAIPDRPAADLGWIVPTASNGHPGPIRVERFVEKPPKGEAESLARSGALWNTMVMAVQAGTLWRLGWKHLPEAMGRFETLKQTLHAVRHGRAAAGHEGMALNAVYNDMPRADLSRDLLEASPEALRVLPMPGVEWSDWGRPERVSETLVPLAKAPLFAGAAALPGPAGGHRGGVALVHDRQR